MRATKQMIEATASLDCPTWNEIPEEDRVLMRKLAEELLNTGLALLPDPAPVHEFIVCPVCRGDESIKCEECYGWSRPAPDTAIRDAVEKIESDADFIAACDSLINSLLGWWLDRKGGKETMPTHMSDAWASYQQAYKAWRAANYRYVSTVEPEIVAVAALEGQR